jgi:MFS family permease
LLHPSLRYILGIGLLIGILQQATGINAVYFYATTIFKQTGIGVSAAFFSGVLLSFTSVVFTLVAMATIDRFGRRPLLLAGMAGIAISMLACSYGFYGATYQLTNEDIAVLEKDNKSIESGVLLPVAGKIFNSDVEFRSQMKEALGDDNFQKSDGAILEAAIEINAMLVLLGVLGFIACFAFSLGPVMWVMLSELYPNRIRGTCNWLHWIRQFVYLVAGNTNIPMGVNQFRQRKQFFNFRGDRLRRIFHTAKITSRNQG